jgi:hypothetical protein
LAAGSTPERARILIAAAMSAIALAATKMRRWPATFRQTFSTSAIGGRGVAGPGDHFRTALISENSVLSRLPRLVKIATKASAIIDAKSAYSIAVAPELFERKARIRMYILALQVSIHAFETRYMVKSQIDRV